MTMSNIKPAGWRILIEARQAPEKIGSILLSDDTKERVQLAAVVAKVVGMGPLCYRDEMKFGPNPEPWCKEGDWIFIGKYAGVKFKTSEGGQTDFRIINDDEVIALVDNPDTIYTA